MHNPFKITINFLIHSQENYIYLNRVSSYRKKVKCYKFFTIRNNINTL